MNKDKVREAIKQLTPSIGEVYLMPEHTRALNTLLDIAQKYLDEELVEPMSEEGIKSTIQSSCAGSLIPCKDPRKLTLDEIRNAFKMFEERLCQALKGKV